MKRIMTVIMGTIMLAAICTGCTTIGGGGQKKYDAAYDRLNNALEMCRKNKANQTFFLQQVGQPHSREKTKSGELWMYSWQDTKTYQTPASTMYVQGKPITFPAGIPKTSHYKMHVNIGFDANGIVSGYNFGGNLLAFKHVRFHTLVAPPAPVVIPDPPGWAEAYSSVTQALNTVMSANGFFSQHAEAQLGKPASIAAREKGGAHWNYHYEAPSQRGTGRNVLSVRFDFSESGEMVGYSTSGSQVGAIGCPVAVLKAQPGILIGSRQDSSRVVFFDSYPEGKAYFTWTGGSQGLMADGAGTLRVFTADGQEAGAIGVTLKQGFAQGSVKILKNSAVSVSLDLSIGGTHW